MENGGGDANDEQTYLRNGERERPYGKINGCKVYVKELEKKIF